MDDLDRYFARKYAKQKPEWEYSRARFGWQLGTFKWLYETEYRYKRVKDGQEFPSARTRRAAYKLARKRVFTIRGLKRDTLQEGKRSEDDMLLGYKVLRWSPVYLKLISPSMLTVWETPALKAETWTDRQALRGQVGIHASWPHSQEGKIAAELNSYLGFSYRWPARKKNKKFAYDSLCVLAEVVGWGQCAVGDLGFRSELMMLRKLYVADKKLMKDIQNAYPEVEVIHASDF